MARRLHVFPDALRFGRELGRLAGLPTAPVEVHRFPDGESLVRVEPPAGTHALLVRSLDDPNEKLVETLLAADALRRAGARRVTLISPYLPYMRQDRVFREGEPISQRVVCGLLGSAFDGLITLEPHLHRTRSLANVFPGRVRALSSAPLVARWLRRAGRRTLLVGPDRESEPWVRAVARRTGLPWTVGVKRREGDRRVRVRFEALPAARRAVIVDDIASSGTTLAEAARSLRREGVERVDAVVVHPVFAPRALAKIRRAGVERIVSCDTIGHETNAIRTAPHFARALAAPARRSSPL